MLQNCSINDSADKGQKRAQQVQKQQLFGLFSKTFHDLGLITRLSRIRTHSAWYVQRKQWNKDNIS